ncbi:MAG: MBL fold metallo-hydrolase, partial [Candidatus Hermodarchaeota archaeon]
MKEVYPGIFLIKETGTVKSVKPTINVYVLAGHDGLIFDAGYGDKTTEKYIIEEIKKIEDIYLSKHEKFRLTRVIPSHSHPDHVSALKLLRKYVKVKIVLTKKMAEIVKDKRSYLRIFKPNIAEDLLRKNSLWIRIKQFIKFYFWWRLYRKAYGLKFINNPDEIIDESTEISINGEIWRIIPSP